MSKKLISLMLLTFMLVSCENVKKEESITLPNIDSVDLLEKVLVNNDLGFNRNSKNNFSITTNQSIGNYTISNGKISEIKIDKINENELSYNHPFKSSKRDLSNFDNDDQINSTYSYNDNGILVAANTNGQQFKNETSSNNDEVVQTLSIDGEVGITISLSDHSVKKEFPNGSYLLADKSSETEMKIISNNQNIARVKLDSSGNYIEEQDGIDIRFSDYDEQGNIIKVRQNNFEYAISNAEDSISKRISIGDKNTTLSIQTNGLGHKYLFDGDEYNVISDEMRKSITLNGKNINYINNVRKNPYEQMYVDSIEMDGEELFSYKVDNLGNIVFEETGSDTDEYTYDYLGQLSSWNHNGNSTYYSFDERGNLTEEIDDNLYNAFEYGNGDTLLKYNEDKVSYDNLYNIVSFGNNNYSYERGNVLHHFSNHEYDIEYKYDINNIRKVSIINGKEHKYYYVDTKLILEDDGENQVFYLYDTDDKAIGFNYCGNNYFYIRDAKQCIEYIMDAKGNMLVKYDYDPWGNIINIEDESDIKLSTINKIIYKGYYFDFETSLYYLMSRYYSPVLKRFITRDSLERISASGTSDLNLNLFCYANNNPIMKGDAMGYEAIAIAGVTISTALIYAIIAIVLFIAAYVIVDMIIDACRKSGVNYKAINAIENSSDKITQVFNFASSASALAILTWLSVCWKWWDNTYRGKYEVHHIIAQSAYEHAEPRRWLGNYGSNVNDSRNLVSIKKILHKHLHTSTYYSRVKSALEPYQKNKYVEFFGVLGAIKAGLSAFSESLPS